MEEEAFDSKIDLCGVCGTRVMSDSVLCTACGKWVHARCTNKKKVAVYLNKYFVCEKCRSVVENFKGPADEKLCDGVETVSKFSYLDDRLNATGGCETAVTARTSIGWMKFREWSEILKSRRFSLKMKGKIYKSYIRSAMSCGSEAWCLRERDGNFEKNRKSYDSSDVWCEAIRAKKQRGVDGHVGHKRAFR